MRRVIALAAVSLLAAGPAAAQQTEVVGTYRLIGRGGDLPYEGQVSVERSGETYTVNWNIGGAKHVGTGLLNGRVFSVVFADPNGVIGVAAYEARGSGVWEGTYTVLGGTAVGEEDWTPVGAR